LPGVGGSFDAPPRRWLLRRSVPRRSGGVSTPPFAFFRGSAGPGGGPGSLAGFSRRMAVRRSGPRRSSWNTDPHRGQRSSSVVIDDKGATE
jgi:hypothetical protein